MSSASFFFVVIFCKNGQGYTYEMDITYDK